MTHFTVLIAVLPITLMTNENDILVKMDWLDWWTGRQVSEKKLPDSRTFSNIQHHIHPNLSASVVSSSAIISHCTMNEKW